jgi:hypothetical protein
MLGLEKKKDLAGSPFASVLVARRPVSYGILDGPEYRIDWAIYAPNEIGRHPVAVVTTVKAAGVQCNGSFEIDAIEFSRTIANEAQWKQLVVEMAVRSLRSAGERTAQAS